MQSLVRYTSLRPRIVRASIIVLVQHNLLWHSDTDDEGEVLEFNTEECLMRMRYGRYVRQAEQLFGQPVSAAGNLNFTGSNVAFIRQRKFYH